MEQLTLDFNSTLTAEQYMAGLSRTSNGLGVKWNIESFSVWTNLKYSHITLVPGQIWTGSNSKYKLICEKHGQYEARADSLFNRCSGCQCKRCSTDKQVKLVGKKRAPKATKEERDLAAKLRLEGLTFDEISRRLSRSSITIRCWLDPIQAEKKRQDSAKWASENKEHHKATKRRYNQFDHGKAVGLECSATRRLLKTNTPEVVFLDGQWHEVDRRKTNDVFSEVLLPAKERKAIQELYMEAQYQTETTGVEHHLDHIQPLSKGGEHLMINLQILPAGENLSKNNTFRVEDQALICKRLFN